ncbi:RNA dependent RNA polymerase-domain-containing protein [Melanogaster broomeanus]|nr:RNA dependent RNA polymerase-domain-containing protein [Melanogaster broomeanus]
MYRIAAVEPDVEVEPNYLEAEPEVDIPSRISRNPSEESLFSTRSSVYSGLDDLTQVMMEVPAETSSPMISPTVSNINTSSSESLPASQSSRSSMSSNADSVLGKRKSISGADESSSSAKDAQAEEVVIAHHRHLQRVFDNKRISFGVQWMIARLVTLGKLKYEGIMVSDIDKLKGPSEFAAPLVDKLFLGSGEGDAGKFFMREKAATSPWKELDREQECVNNGDGFHRHSDGWYGGKVQFSATLKLSDDEKTKRSGSNYKIYLNKPELGPSSRFSRRFGSHAVLRVRISRTILGKGQYALVKFFSQRFLLCGMIYRAFYAKDGTAFLIVTDELWGTTCLPKHVQPRPLSFLEFLDWHNPILLNSSQTMAKWASRFALGLSNSVPGIIVSQDNILSLNDEGSDMTDGAGYINLAALKLLQALFNWGTIPTAIQCRIAGAKGLLLRHPDSSENESLTPCIWLRPSQVKIKYPVDQPLSDAHITIDVLRSSHLRTPTHLSAETIVNLAENQVPHQVFVNLVKENLNTIVDSLLDWNGPDSMFKLWNSVARAGGVITARMAREAAGEARMRGYFVKDVEEEEDDDLDGSVNSPQSAAWWGDETSGCPSSLEETVLTLLDAGFTPQQCPLLAEKLKSVIKTQVDNYVQRYRLGVLMSCIAWIVPDPFGTLAPDEIQILSHDASFVLPDGTKSHVVLGDVLLTRHPCKLPTDVQKVKAVLKPQLQHYKDVIVCSIQGSRRFADLLAGGDYDGDKAIAIWQPEIVNGFKSPPLHYSVPPATLMENFKKDITSAAAFLERYSGGLQAAIPDLQAFLLAGLQDTTQVGKYSNFHDVAIYTRGYSHPDTIRLAYMFCTILDGAKSGISVLPEVVQKDSQKFQKRAPLWKETIEEARHESNELNVARPASLSSFVMDTIFIEARDARDMKLFQMEHTFPKVKFKDASLLGPWNDTEERIRRLRMQDQNHATRMTMELSRVQVHVEEMCEEYKGSITKEFTGFRIERRQDILRQLAHKFAKSPDPSSFLCFSADELSRLKASYAYKIGDLNGRFAFSLAMRELGYIKARSLGPTKTVQLGFYDRFVVKQSLLQ